MKNDSPLHKHLLKGMKGNGGQKNGTFAPGCNGGGGEVNWRAVGVDVDVEVEELADWDVADADVPLPFVAGAADVPATEPEEKKDHIQTVPLTQRYHRSNLHLWHVMKFLLQHLTCKIEIVFYI